MRIVLAASILVLTSGIAFAQKEKLRPAPVPGDNPGMVTPADRAGTSNTSDNSAPFAGAPNNMIPGGGQPTPSTIGTPGDRQSVPAPSVTK